MKSLELRSETPVSDAATPRRRTAAGQSTLFGYSIVREIGRGAGSIVYEVRDPATGRAYALKHVVVSEPKHLRFIEQLEREEEVGKLVRHEGLRQPLTIQYKRTLLRRVTEAALLMEYVEGWPVSVPTRPIRQALGYLTQISRTLEAFHRAGFVHCDLKPQNLLIDRELKVKLIDLGQACRAGTVKERVQGTPDFISPEQVKLREVTPRTDVYNLGATAYCILTGRKIPTLFTVKKGGFLLDDRIAPPHELCEEVPQLLSALVMQCIALRPEQRPEMAEVTRRLDAIHYMMKEPKPARPHSRSRRQ